MRFRWFKKVLRDFGIEWDEEIGKGSHGAFIGLTYHTRILHVHVLPRSKQTDVQRKYLNPLRRQSELTADDGVSDILFT